MARLQCRERNGLNSLTEDVRVNRAAKMEYGALATSIRDARLKNAYINPFLSPVLYIQFTTQALILYPTVASLLVQPLFLYLSFANQSTWLLKRATRSLFLLISLPLPRLRWNGSRISASAQSSTTQSPSSTKTRVSAVDDHHVYSRSLTSTTTGDEESLIFIQKSYLDALKNKKAPGDDLTVIVDDSFQYGQNKEKTKRWLAFHDKNHKPYQVS